MSLLDIIGFVLLGIGALVFNILYILERSAHDRTRRELRLLRSQMAKPSESESDMPSSERGQCESVRRAAEAGQSGSRPLL